MDRPRLQFRLITLLWITLTVACWFGGMRYERWRAERAALWTDDHEDDRQTIIEMIERARREGR
jgi:hypothetical protein